MLSHTPTLPYPHTVLRCLVSSAVAVLAAGCLLAQGRAGQRTGAVPPHPGYVLPRYTVSGVFSGNALTLFDPASMSVVKRVGLPRTWAKNFARDPQGRVWIGLSGDMQRTDRRVQVYSPDGRLTATLSVGGGPEAG